MPTPDRTRRWLHLSPDRFVISLMLLIGLLWLSERFQWFGLNHHKGWTVLIAVAAVGVAAIAMLLWWIISLIFRWRFQFGIRSLLAFCLASSIAASWLAAETRRARRQAEVVAGSSSDSLPFYDWQVDADDSPISNPEPPGPGWLRRVLGVDFFSTVYAIYYTDTSFTDTGLERLNCLDQLRALDLSGSKTTNAGLEQLNGLAQLRGLSLRGTTITDAGLEQLKKLKQLQVLDVTGTKVTDAGLEHLKGLTQLQELYLTNTNVTGDGVERLRRTLPTCKIVR